MCRRRRRRQQPAIPKRQRLPRRRTQAVRQLLPRQFNNIRIHIHIRIRILTSSSSRHMSCIRYKRLRIIRTNRSIHTWLFISSSNNRIKYSNRFVLRRQSRPCLWPTYPDIYRRARRLIRQWRRCPVSRHMRPLRRHHRPGHRCLRPHRPPSALHSRSSYNRPVQRAAPRLPRHRPLYRRRSRRHHQRLHYLSPRRRPPTCLRPPSAQ